MMKLKFSSVFAVCSCVFIGRTVLAQTPEWSQPPKLVVGIVVDQMRVDYIYRFWDNFSDGGFKRLVNEGAFLRDTHYDYAPTETGPGHASVYTGTSPMHHGITMNDMFWGPDHTHHYCVADTSKKTVGASGTVGQRSPINLLASTLADELELRTQKRSKTIGVALKDRSAILPMGRTGDAAYWFSADATGTFVTSTWYAKELPKWLVEFNAKGLARKYAQQTWELFLPLERYNPGVPDVNPYDGYFESNRIPVLPMDLKAIYDSTGTTEIVKYTPWGSTLTTDLAIATLIAEKMGADAITDLLAISYSSPDELGHQVGPHALELEDAYLRLDRDLERLFATLDAQVGAGEYTVFLTADHGVGDVPQYLKDLGASAGYVEVNTLAVELNKVLETKFGAGKWVRSIRREHVYLNDSLITANNVDPEEIQRASAAYLILDPNIQVALTATDLMREEYTDGVRKTMQRSFMFQRCGDLMLVYRPGFLEAYGGGGRGTTHMTPWNFDTQVPALFFGKNIKHGEVLRRTSITDIAPTVSAIVGMSLPNAATGRVVPEVVK